MCLEKPIRIAPTLRNFPKMLPLKKFQSLSDWQMAPFRPFKEDCWVLPLSTPLSSESQYLGTSGICIQLLLCFCPLLAVHWCFVYEPVIYQCEYLTWYIYTLWRTSESRWSLWWAHCELMRSRAPVFKLRNHCSFQEYSCNLPGQP